MLEATQEHSLLLMPSPLPAPESRRKGPRDLPRQCLPYFLLDTKKKSSSSSVPGTGKKWGQNPYS